VDLCVLQGKSDMALEQHLVDLRMQNADLMYSGPSTTSSQMESALATAIRLASILSSSQSQDTIQQAMAVLDSVNKKLYGMIDQTESSSKTEEETRPSAGNVQPRGGTTPLESVRGYGDDDDYEEYGFSVMPPREQPTVKKPLIANPPGIAASSSAQQRAAPVPSKRFRFGL